MFPGNWLYNCLCAQLHYSPWSEEEPNFNIAGRSLYLHKVTIISVKGTIVDWKMHDRDLISALHLRDGVPVRTGQTTWPLLSLSERSASVAQ